jgi:hypothetical protein
MLEQGRLVQSHRVMCPSARTIGVELADHHSMAFTNVVAHAEKAGDLHHKRGRDRCPVEALGDPSLGDHRPLRTHPQRLRDITALRDHWAKHPAMPVSGDTHRLTASHASHRAPPADPRQAHAYYTHYYTS